MVWTTVVALPSPTLEKTLLHSVAERLVPYWTVYLSEPAALKVI